MDRIFSSNKNGKIRDPWGTSVILKYYTRNSELKIQENTYLSLYDLQDTIHPFPHALPIDRVQKPFQLRKQFRFPLEIVKMVIHPVSQHVKHSKTTNRRLKSSNTPRIFPVLPKLHRLAIFLPVLLPILPLVALLHLLGVAAILLVHQRGIRYVEPLDQKVQKLVGGAETSVRGQEGAYEFRIGVYVVSQSFNKFIQGGALKKIR